MCAAQRAQRSVHSVHSAAQHGAAQHGAAQRRDAGREETFSASDGAASVTMHAGVPAAAAALGRLQQTGLKASNCSNVPRPAALQKEKKEKKRKGGDEEAAAEAPAAADGEKKVGGAPTAAGCIYSACAAAGGGPRCGVRPLWETCAETWHVCVCLCLLTCPAFPAPPCRRRRRRRRRRREAAARARGRTAFSRCITSSTPPAARVPPPAPIHAIAPPLPAPLCRSISSLLLTASRSSPAPLPAPTRHS